MNFLVKKIIADSEIGSKNQLQEQEDSEHDDIFQANSVSLFGEVILETDGLRIVYIDEVDKAADFFGPWLFSKHEVYLAVEFYYKNLLFFLEIPYLDYIGKRLRVYRYARKYNYYITLKYSNLDVFLEFWNLGQEYAELFIYAFARLAGLVSKGNKPYFVGISKHVAVFLNNKNYISLYAKYCAELYGANYPLYWRLMFYWLLENPYLLESETSRKWFGLGATKSTGELILRFEVEDFSKLYVNPEAALQVLTTNVDALVGDYFERPKNMLEVAKEVIYFLPEEKAASACRYLAGHDFQVKDEGGKWITLRGKEFFNEQAWYFKNPALALIEFLKKFDAEALDKNPAVYEMLKPLMDEVKVTVAVYMEEKFQIKMIFNALLHTNFFGKGYVIGKSVHVLVDGNRLPFFFGELPKEKVGYFATDLGMPFTDCFVKAFEGTVPITNERMPRTLMDMVRAVGPDLRFD
jgi:hypothetical protein